MRRKPVDITGLHRRFAPNGLHRAANTERRTVEYSAVRRVCLRSVYEEYVKFGGLFAALVK